ncbi:Mitochondrial PGP phosphatase domain containing protein [Amanita muscaria]
MPLNVPGLLAPFQLLVRPRLVIPSLVVKDIRQIDFGALRKEGYRGIVFDKDNCLTLPHKDTLVPEIANAWDECRHTFGAGNVVIVSNSAGTWVDPGGIQSESVSYHLRVPVLSHRRFKPSYSCITDIRTYFSSLRFPIRDEELVIVGDRIFTDIIMANRMRCWKPRQSIFSLAASCAFEKEGAIETEQEVKEVAQANPCGPLAIWTTGVWEREAMIMRCAEKWTVQAVQRYSKPKQGQVLDTAKFLKPIPEPPKKTSIIDRILDKVYSST